MRFSWEGYTKLVPALIGAGARGKGTIDFTLRTAKELAADYDGVITFLFDTPTTQNAQAVSFLYKATTGGLRLTSLARDSIQGMTVTHVGISPIVIFFTPSP